MKIINTAVYGSYCPVLGYELAPGRSSSDKDHLDIFKSMAKVVRSCGNTFLAVLSDKERETIERLLEIDRKGRDFKPPEACRLSPAELSLRASLAEAQRKDEERERSIVEERNREEAIRSETNWASREDIDAAHSRASMMNGDVAPKKLASTGGKPVSIRDLMGDNRYIEDRLKGSGIRTVLASDEGWDAKKVDESNAGKEVRVDKPSAVPAVAAVPSWEDAKPSAAAEDNSARPSEPAAASADKKDASSKAKTASGSAKAAGAVLRRRDK